MTIARGSWQLEHKRKEVRLILMILIFVIILKKSLFASFFFTAFFGGSGFSISSSIMLQFTRMTASSESARSRFPFWELTDSRRLDDDFRSGRRNGKRRQGRCRHGIARWMSHRQGRTSNRGLSSPKFDCLLTLYQRHTLLGIARSDCRHQPLQRCLFSLGLVKFQGYIYTMPFCCFQNSWKAANNLWPSSSETFSLLSKVVWIKTKPLFILSGWHGNQQFEFAKPRPNPFSCFHSNVWWTQVIHCLLEFLMIIPHQIEISNGVTGIFDCHVDTHSLHILSTMHALYTFVTRFWHI